MLVRPADHDATGAAPTEQRFGIPKWEVVLLLWFAFFLNQADRQIFGVTLPLIQVDFGLTSGQMGLVATTFTIVFGLLVPIAGALGDRFDRGWVVVLSLVIFSSGTLLTGLASGYLMLLLFRGVATGGGEAFYSPAATAWVAERHVATRARALSLHQTANYTGVILGSLFAGWVAERHGWRAAFFLYGCAGLLWALVIIVRMRRYPRPARAGPRPGGPALHLGEALALILRTPALLVQTLGFSGLIFVLVGYTTWMPTMLYERFGLSLAEAGFSAVVYHHVLAYAGLLSSVVTDRLIGRMPGVRLYSMAVALSLCAPFIWLAANDDRQVVVYLALGAFGLFRGVYDGNLYAAIFDATEDRLRSSVAGLIIAFAFVVGAASAWIMGAMKARYGLESGLELLGGVALGVGLTCLAAVPVIRKKYDRSQERLPER